VKKIAKPAKKRRAESLVEQHDGIRHPKHQPIKQRRASQHWRDELIPVGDLHEDR
jgi:hypothetical protein